MRTPTLHQLSKMGRLIPAKGSVLNSGKELNRRFLIHTGISMNSFRYFRSRHTI